MPSPFPGMDPYLERPVFFGGLHTAMISYLREALQAVLPEPYYAESGERAWFEIDRHVEPDVNVLRAELPTPRERGGVLVAEAALTAPVVVRVLHEPFRELYLDVWTRLGDEERLVTTIEILSPTNKTPGEHGRNLYLRKQQAILSSKTHLVEIDLLRGGHHSTSVPWKHLEKKGLNFDYHVCVKHFDNLEDYYVYPIYLAERLPTVAIPLLPDDGVVAVDLQTAFDRSYDTGPYRRRVRYTEPVPPPALVADKAAWVEQVLCEKGFRGAQQPAARKEEDRPEGA
jgi:hypothetical protein